MNKDEVIRNVSYKTGTTQSVAGNVISAFLDVITDSMISGDYVRIAGFGTFEAKDRKARVGRNPHNNEEVQIPARRMPVFTPASALKSKIS